MDSLSEGEIKRSATEIFVFISALSLLIAFETTFILFY